ncbi:Acetyltransferase NSI [Saliniradius amylolyticus]|uniref:Acetyltransferase NSI n=1 Tax=Saliniradius amylolyticus TaxID=2183582 RepID=A0A2S2E4F5_9ALTE|nr:GNAT family N-acetyltransferase [Saliniradius amylolyticus]AWL12535.1 Acetyltransferase NSI [Saliniradius amylolyticus]
MKPTNYVIIDVAPTAKEFIALRCEVDWDRIDLDVAHRSLDNSLFQVSVRDNKKLIGMARVVGDGFMYFYIQDVVVTPEYQGQGIGRMLMNRVERYLSKACQVGSTVGLLAAQGKEAFYRSYGYIERDGTHLGKGMCRFVREQP